MDVCPSFFYMDISYVPIRIILAIMEIETWFLAEATHFTRINISLINKAIKIQSGLIQKVIMLNAGHSRQKT